MFVNFPKFYFFPFILWDQLLGWMRAARNHSEKFVETDKVQGHNNCIFLLFLFFVTKMFQSDFELSRVHWFWTIKVHLLRHPKTAKIFSRINKRSNRLHWWIKLNVYLFIYVCQRLSAWKINSSESVLTNSLCVRMCCHKLESNCHGWSISRL